MTARTLPELSCPVCSAELTVEQLFAHAETRQAFARLAAVSLPLGSKLLAYVNLFAPAKNRMSIARKVKVIEELLPDLERGAIDRKGREWDAPREAWSDAIEQMLAARDARKLTLPLTSHGYLYEILAGMADKAEASEERQAEQARRDRPSTPDLLLRPAQNLSSAAVAAPPGAQTVTPGTSPLVRRMQALQRRPADSNPTEDQP